MLIGEPVARLTLYGHHKFKLFAHLVGDQHRALGLLEFMWLSAYRAGHADLGTPLQVANACQYQGKPHWLVSRLLEAGFIESVTGHKDLSRGSPQPSAEPHQRVQVNLTRGLSPGSPQPSAQEFYRVHDFWDHAPEYVKKRVKREEKRLDEAKTDRTDGSQVSSHLSASPMSGSSPIQSGTPYPHANVGSALSHTRGEERTQKRTRRGGEPSQAGAYVEPPGARPGFGTAYAAAYVQARQRGKSIDEATEIAKRATGNETVVTPQTFEPKPGRFVETGNHQVDEIPEREQIEARLRRLIGPVQVEG